MKIKNLIYTVCILISVLIFTSTTVFSEGDDYEICFTIPLDKKDRLRDYILDKKITEIGSVTKELDFIVENNKHEIIKFTKGYSHF